MLGGEMFGKKILNFFRNLNKLKFFLKKFKNLYCDFMGNMERGCERR